MVVVEISSVGSYLMVAGILSSELNSAVYV